MSWFSWSPRRGVFSLGELGLCAPHARGGGRMSPPTGVGSGVGGTSAFVAGSPGAGWRVESPRGAGAQEDSEDDEGEDEEGGLGAGAAGDARSAAVGRRVQLDLAIKTREAKHFRALYEEERDKCRGIQAALRKLRGEHERLRGAAMRAGVAVFGDEAGGGIGRVGPGGDGGGDEDVDGDGGWWGGSPPARMTGTGGLRMGTSPIRLVASPRVGHAAAEARADPYAGFAAYSPEAQPGSGEALVLSPMPSPRRAQRVFLPLGEASAARSEPRVPGVDLLRDPGGGCGGWGRGGGGV